MREEVILYDKKGFVPSKRAKTINDYLTIGQDTSDAEHYLHITGNEDAYIWLDADRNNTGEENNSWVKYSQDGRGVNAFTGLIGASGKDPSGGSFTGTLQPSYSHILIESSCILLFPINLNI